MSGGAEWGAQADAWGAPAGAAAAADEPELSPDEAQDAETERRERALRIHNALDGSTGLIHIHEASSGAVDTFRLHLTTSFYSGSGFLCSADTHCQLGGPNGTETEDDDDASRSALSFGLSATPLPFLEAFAALHSSATYNDHGQPALLQALGDANIGAKGFMPYEPDAIFSFGGELSMWLLNGTGDVGVNFDGTSFDIRALATADLTNRINPGDRIPLRFHANLGYAVNNAGMLVEDTESQRDRRINRIERFGLGIDRVDFFKIGLAAEFVHEIVRPFAEWSIDVPNNRQDYTCFEDVIYPGDGCLGNDSGAKTMPSRLTLGARVTPWIDGFSAQLALDLGTGATSTFIEEVAPELPWNLYLGLGFAVDTVPKTVVREVRVEAPPPVAQAEPKRFIAGTVIDAKSREPVPEAIVRFKDRDLTGMVASQQGVFVTGNLTPGTYAFIVTKEGYRDGECEVTVPAAASAGAGTQQPAPAQQPGQVQDPNMAAGGGQWAAPGAPPADVQTTIRCELKTLPAVGNVTGEVVNTATREAVAGAAITITDKLGRQLELVASGRGEFRFENVPAGTVRLNVSAEGYLPTFMEIDVETQKDHRAQVSLNPKPEKPAVTVTRQEVKLSRKVHFQHDSAEILPDSMSLLQEAAQVIKEHAEIRGIEVQGHTDNTGLPAYNTRLSQERAQAVVDALVKLGVDADKLVAKGYGADKPLVPNLTDFNRAKNRRVQLVITERE
jgi:outer membrane protein OmpA-like peptidoglycan-associated protein